MRLSSIFFFNHSLSDSVHLTTWIARATFFDMFSPFFSYRQTSYEVYIPLVQVQTISLTHFMLPVSFYTP